MYTKICNQTNHIRLNDASKEEQYERLKTNTNETSNTELYFGHKNSQHWGEHYDWLIN